MENTIKNRLIRRERNKYLAIPRFKEFTERNLGTKIFKDKRKKSRKQTKQDFLKELQQEGII